MNEKKIQALAEQANLGPCCESQAVAIKKFAELIIEETYKCILEPIFDDSHCPSLLEVKKHFGVKE